MSPVAAYVRDNCDVGIGHEILIADLFADWRAWCEDNGHKPGSVQTFGRDLRAVIPHLRVLRPREGENKRKRRYIGLRLSTAHNGEDRGPSRTGDGSQPTVDDLADTCSLCGAPLLAPHSQQRGICERCWLHMPDDEAETA